MKCTNYRLVRISVTIFLFYSGIMVQQGWGKSYLNSGRDTLGNDFFPLQKNLMYEYGLYVELRTTWVVVTEELYVDSGNVVYIVRDSQFVNDSTLEWTVERRENIYHDYWNDFGTDTTYWTSDTVTGSLTENLNGNHEIFSSLGLWRFPLSRPTQSIFRYHPDSSFVSYKRLYNDTTIFSGNTVDSILFHVNDGLVERWTSSFAGPGNTHYSSNTHIWQLHSPVTAVLEEKNGQFPVAVNLYQNYPNPFNAITKIDFDIGKTTNVKINIYDILGRKVAALADREYLPGNYSIQWNADKLPSGVYFYTLQTESSMLTKRLILLK